MLKELETPNLLLRKAKLSDLDSICNNIWIDEEIANNMLWETTKTKEFAIERLNRTINYQKDNYAYFVCLKDTDEAIGFAGVKEIEKGIYEDSGLCIARKYQGKGYAKEVVDALKKLVFVSLKGNRFIYGCFKENEKSRNVCLSRGFIYFKSEKTIRKWDNKEFIVDYHYFDKDMYMKNI